MKRIDLKKPTALMLAVVLATSLLGFFVEKTYGSELNMLKNGGFEDVDMSVGESNRMLSSNHVQLDEAKVEGWHTTAYDKKIEIFKENTGTYMKGVALKPFEGRYAAEINCTEESTLYQVVPTPANSIYEWGLAHGGRSELDVMAIIIGPKQDAAPTKMDTEARDQFMQMIDWLKTKPKVYQSMNEPGIYNEGKAITIYSKKFAANGQFVDNRDGHAFSLNASETYSEEWKIWLVADSKSDGDENKWNSYGLNDEGSAGSVDEKGSTEIDTSKYYLYQVPEDQEETIFAFVSVETKSTGKNKMSLGNFLDAINFKLYHNVTASTSAHGSGIVDSNDVSLNSPLSTYIEDGRNLRIEAKVHDNRSDFIGAYCTINGEKIYLGTDSNNVIEHKEGTVTDKELLSEKYEGKWIKTMDGDGLETYSYLIKAVSGPVDIHFVFIKSPTITYYANGGMPYDVKEHYDVYTDSEGNEQISQNVYSFKPEISHTSEGQKYVFISPYESYKPGVKDGIEEGSWMFTGWALYDDKGIVSDKDGPILLPDKHSVACNYEVREGDESIRQRFVIIDGNNSFTTAGPNADGRGQSWTKADDDTVIFESGSQGNLGLTMVAQWRWRQAFIPQVYNGETYVDSTKGGSVEIYGKDSSRYYNESYTSKGGKAYFTDINETVTAIAHPEEGYSFMGWYDKNGDLITNKAKYTYTAGKQQTATIYAKFSSRCKQQYVRQIQRPDNEWMDINDDEIGTLTKYTDSQPVGNQATSKATAGKDYKFVGWYYKNDEGEYVPVPKSMLSRGDETTLVYNIEGNAVYYAHLTAKEIVEPADPTEESTHSSTAEVSENSEALDASEPNSQSESSEVVNPVEPKERGNTEEVINSKEIGQESASLEETTVSPTDISSKDIDDMNTSDKNVGTNEVVDETKTGDNINLLAPVILMLAAVAVFGIIAISARKNGFREDD